jgi:thioredoxin-dependent peroxiredoxin
LFGDCPSLTTEAGSGRRVYQTDSWTINIKPLFTRELKALFGNIYPDDVNYLKFRNFYRFYLVVYLLLFAAYFNFKKDDTMNELSIRKYHPVIYLARSGWKYV